MATCICDGPPHQYDPSWCGDGRNAYPPHGKIRQINTEPWDNTPYDIARDADYRRSIPRIHGGVGTPPSPPRKVGTEATPDHSMNVLDALRKKRETAENVLYLRKMAEEYEAEGLLEEADRLTKIADSLEGK